MTKEEIKLDKEDILDSMQSAKDKFLSNMDTNKIVRKSVFKQIYKLQKGSGAYSGSWGDFYRSVKGDWEQFSPEDKSKFFDMWVGDVKNDPTATDDISYIMGSLKLNNFNIKKVFKDIKEYGDMKKKGQLKK